MSENNSLHHDENSYESRVRKNQYRRAVKLAVIILLVSTLILTPTFWLWRQFIYKNQAVREAKNVVLNMEMLGIIFSGTGEEMMDGTKSSGMTREIQDKVRLYSGAEGEINLRGWDATKAKVLSLTYRKGKYIISYRYDSKKDESQWDVYWLVQTMKNE